MSSPYDFMGMRSPPRRPIVIPSPTSPFCTSPSQLEEVTLDAETSIYSAGLRSPIIGARGRSIKEFEEQLSGLRKENFNLKLRIYFLEERMGNNFKLDQEDAVKKNIELMVELESLKKELQEKQDLLCQAVKAMELEEDEHRKENDGNEKQLKELREQVEALQQQCDLLQEESQSQMVGRSDSCINSMDDPQEVIVHLEGRIADLEEQLRSEHGNVQTSAAPSVLSLQMDQLQATLNEKEDKLCETLSLLDEKCTLAMELQEKVNNISTQLLKRDREVSTMRLKLDERINEVKELECNISVLRKSNDDLKQMNENECLRNERQRIAISHRNSKISELESIIEKYKIQVSNLEVKLESALNEVKSKTNETTPARGINKSHTLNITDGTSISVRSTSPHADNSSAAGSLGADRKMHSPNSKSTSKQNASGDEIDFDNTTPKAVCSQNVAELQEEVVRYQKHVTKLEQDQLKACRIIQTMLETRKRNGKEIEELHRSLQKRETVINEMRAKLRDNQPAKHSSSKDVELESERKSIQDRVSELNLTAAAPSTDTERSMLEDGLDPTILLEQYKQLADNMETQKQILLETMKEKDAQMKELEGKYETICKDLKIKENRIVELEFDLLNPPDNDRSVSREKVDSGNEKVSFWIKESEEKDREIEKLEKELAKRTSDLQNVVNKELWQKNREIEKLQKYMQGVEKKDVEIAELKKQINEYENKAKVYNKLLKEYEEEKKRERDSIQEKLNFSNEDRNDLLIELNQLNHQIVQITKDNQRLKEELRLSDTLRIETQEVCTLLGKRLEELALFLDTLLKQKSVLGLLGNKQNKLMRQRVEQTLDLSRTLSISFQMNPDQSLVQLSNISELLNTTNRTETSPLRDLSQNTTNLSIVPDNVTLTYQSHLNVKTSDGKEDQNEIIRVLRAQIDKLKSEIELRDNELAQRMSLHNLAQNELIEQLAELSTNSNPAFTAEDILRRLKVHGERRKQQLDHSDSESWSEPDRSVSKARIGLDDKTLKPKTKMISESTELDARPLSRTPSKKSIGSEGRLIIAQLSEQISQLDKIVKEKDDLMSKTVTKKNALDLKLQEWKNRFNEVNEKCLALEERIAAMTIERSDLEVNYHALEKSFTAEMEQSEKSRHEMMRLQQTIDSLEDSLRVALEAKAASENEISVLHGKIENLEAYKALLTESMDSKTKCIQNRLNELEVEKAQAQHATKLAEDKRNEALAEITIISDKLLNAEINHAKSSATAMGEAEKEIERRIQLAEKDFNVKVELIEKNAQFEIKQIRDECAKTALMYENGYVPKAEVERLQTMITELKSVQEVLSLSEEKVKELELSEDLLKKQLFETECMYRNKLNDLRKDLDSATLHCSQLQLEKTRTEDEKMQLEAKLNECVDREEVFEQQVADLKNEFAALKDNFTRQVAALEHERGSLQVKITKMETVNTDLKNKITLVQNNNELKSKSAPATPTGRILDLYLAKNQFYTRQFNEMHSNYLARESLNAINRDNENVENIDVERIQANSSPDLGIESDQGRFSSLEAQMVPVRPFAPIINIAASMNEALGRHQDNGVENDCENVKCVKVTKEMNSENHLLKKKLQKSNKLLEETLSQLAMANQRKREVEKNICKQIHKTSQVLKIAKANLDSGSESELVRK